MQPEYVLYGDSSSSNTRPFSGYLLIENSVNTSAPSAAISSTSYFNLFLKDIAMVYFYSAF